MPDTPLPRRPKMDDRLPAHVEVNGLIRAVQAAGGFAMVLAKGERDAGTLLIVAVENGANPQLYERMPQADGTRGWAKISAQTVEKTGNSDDYWHRRRAQDPDIWVIELDIVNGERFIGLTGTAD